MLKIIGKTQVLSLSVFAALAIVPMGTRADDGGSGGAYDFPAANVQDFRIEDRAEENVTCAQATKAAWFMHQLELSDGSGSSAVDTPRECEREIYAKNVEAATE
jgi:hypothetical protein